MSDIFREVDEDLRREQAKRLWDRFGTYVIGLAVLIVLATAGYRIYEYLEERQASESGDRFVAAVKLAEDGKHAEAITALDAIAKDGNGGYPTLAAFRSASEKATAGDDKGAVAGFDAIAQNTSAPSLIRDMARIRAALLLADNATLSDMVARIGDLTAADNVWRHTAREILGLTAWRVNDGANARKYLKAILDDKDTPDDIKSRAAFLTAILDARDGAPAAAAPAAATPGTPAVPAVPVAPETPTPGG